jgi:DNA topoisomerase-1
LDKEEWALYKLIWDRFVASQMTSAVFLQTTVEIKADDGIFTAVGTVPTFLGFMTLYVEGEDNNISNGKQEEGEEEMPNAENKPLPGAYQCFLEVVPEMTPAGLPF